MRCRTVLKRSLLGCRAALILLSSSVAVAAPAYHPAHGSEILWDRYGVAHVYAKTVPDLFYGFGWAQMRSHGNIVARLYAEGRGRAAEYYGAAELENDRWMAVNDVPARARRWLREQEPGFREYLEAFAAGMNDYERAHPDAFDEASRRVFPMSALDVIAHAQRLFEFIYAAPADIVKRLPPDAVAEVASSATQRQSAQSAILANSDDSGSNGWAIAPSRSASGHSMLLMNPHLPWAPGWSTYYEIQLTAPGIDLYGATQIGLPVLRFVFSDYLGFTHTVNAPNAVTFYRIEGADGGYRFDGRVRAFQTRTGSIKVRQPDGTFTTEAVSVRSAIQGPIVAERDGAPIAMRIAGLDRSGSLDQYWRMDTAHDFAGYQAALRRMQIPTFNNLYADRDGHIQYFYMALVPRHAFGDLKYWSSVVPGNTSKTLWNDYLTYEELPKVTDPPGGTVHNSNDPPWNAAWPDTLDPAPYTSEIPADKVSLRMARGIRMLEEHRKISFEDLIADKWSTRSELADRVLPDLLEAVGRFGDGEAREAGDVLAQWDRCMNADSRGALLFMNWSDRPDGVSGYSGAGFARPYQLAEPLTTPAGLADPKAAVVALDAAARDMITTYGALDVPWGSVMRFRGGAVDLPASGAPGRLGVFNAVDYAPLVNGTRAANFGSSYSAIVSFNSPARARVLLSYGSSSQPGSPHASDQLPLLSAGTLRDAWRTRAQVEANLESRDSF
jgi:acyl-homoserine-lactone acylase